MNTNDLLEVAIGMGYSAKISSFNRSQSSHHSVSVYDNDDVFLNPFNPTIGDLILWLMDRGHLELGYKVEAFFFKEHDDYTGLSSKSGKSLKENLLSIALQVIKAEKEE